MLVGGPGPVGWAVHCYCCLLLAITKQAFGSFPCSKLNVSDCRYSAITEGF